MTVNPKALARRATADPIRPEMLRRRKKLDTYRCFEFFLIHMVVYVCTYIYKYDLVSSYLFTFQSFYINLWHCRSNTKLGITYTLQQYFQIINLVFEYSWVESIRTNIVIQVNLKKKYLMPTIYQINNQYLI